VSLPTRNPLQSFPSLQHLSSTQSELENSNVNYSGFDIDMSAPQSTDDELITDDTPTAPPVIIAGYCFSSTSHVPIKQAPWQ
jgi:hypothetical protein